MHDLLRSISWTDAIDVALLTLFLYAVVGWMRERRLRGRKQYALRVFIAFGAAYLLANLLDLYLVRELIEVLFLALTVAAAVIFRTEIRNFIDRVGSGELFGGPEDASDKENHVDVLTEAAFHMADIHRGALIALHGDDEWDTHVKGGVSMGGELSFPLLVSIFNPSSPGHDGALLVRDGKIEQFGVHLPLAREVPEISRYGGTRHSAALGLAERTDAFVVVVSEERGEVSVAKDGELVPVSDATDLKNQLEAFFGRNRPKEERSLLSRYRRRAGTFALAALLAIGTWYTFTYSPGTIYRTYEVPVTFRNAPQGWHLEEAQPPHVQVTLTGPEYAFDRITPDGLAAAFDVPEVEQGMNQFVVTAEELELPSQLSLYDSEPRSVQVEAWPIETHLVPVRLRMQGAIPDSLRDLRLVARPDSVALLIPSFLDSSERVVQTEQFSIERLLSEGTLRIPLILPQDTRLQDAENEKVAVSLQEVGAEGQQDD